MLAPAAHAGATVHPHQPSGPRNVVVMVADGWGFNHLAVTNLYACGRIRCQVYEDFPVRVAMSTHPAGGAYDPTATWSDFYTVLSGATDSAAAATAMSTGTKTALGFTGVGPQGERLVHAFELAERAGRATGVVTSVQWSHATPAGFTAHVSNRSDYAGIAREMVYATPTDVIMGAGHPCFDTDGRPNGCTGITDYVGGPQTWTDLTDADGAEGADADGDGDPDRWTLVQTREQFTALASGRTPPRVLGVAPVAESLQANRSCPQSPPLPDPAATAADSGSGVLTFQDCLTVPYAAPRTSTVPSLREMTRAALNVLDEDPDGFALMVEGGAVDRASHGNVVSRLIEETIDFNEAVEEVVRWVAGHGGWDETLVVVTADHETGYLTGPGSNPAWVPVVSQGRGLTPTVEFHSLDHTNALVPFFARGRGSLALLRSADQHDPVQGPHLDNAELGQALHAMLSPAVRESGCQDGAPRPGGAATCRAVP